MRTPDPCLHQVLTTLDALILENWNIVFDTKIPDMDRAQARGALIAFKSAKRLLTKALKTDGLKNVPTN